MKRSTRFVAAGAVALMSCGFVGCGEPASMPTSSASPDNPDSEVEGTFVSLKVPNMH